MVVLVKSGGRNRMRARPRRMPGSVASHHAGDGLKGSRNRMLEVTESRDAVMGVERSRMLAADGVVLQMMRCNQSFVTLVAPGQCNSCISREGAISEKYNECLMFKSR